MWEELNMKKKKIVSKKTLAKGFRGGIVVLAILAVVSVVLVSAGILYAKSTFSLVCQSVLTLFFLWVYGIRAAKEIMLNCKVLRYIKQGKFEIYIRTITNIEILGRFNVERITYFDNGEVSSKSLEGNVGDTCYAIYFPMKKEVCKLLNIKEYELDDELLTLLRRD